jgi:DNA-binding NarL/FixJ family response regulator
MATVLSNLLSNLAAVRSALRPLPVASSSVHDQGSRSPDGALSRSLGLLEGCLGDVRTLAALLASAPSFQTLQPGHLQGTMGHALDSANGDSAGASAVPDVPDFISPLSSREREVVALLAAGGTNREVARILSISVRTVESHRAKIMLKLNLESLSDLVRYALRNRIVQS